MEHHSVARLIPQIRQRWWLFLLTVIAASVAQTVGIPLAMLTRRMVNLVSKESGAHADPAQIERTLLVLGGVLVGLTLVRGVSRWIKGVLGEVFAQGIIADIRRQMLDHLHDLPLGYFDKRAAGKIVIRFVGDAQGLRGWLANKLVSIPADILTIIGVLVAIGSIHIELLYAVVIPPTVLLPVLFLINPRARQWTRAARAEQSRLTGDLTDRIEMIPAVKVAQAKRASIEPMVERIECIARSFIRRSLLDASVQALAMTVGSLSLCAIGIWGAMLILHSQATSGDIVGAIWLAVLIRSPINRLTSTNIAYHRVKVGFDRIDALLNRKPEPGMSDLAIEYTGEQMRIRLKELGYQDAAGRWLIRGLTGTLVGPGCVVLQGDARSTNVFFEMILRLRRPHEGRIGLDGVNARKLRLEDIRTQIGWVDAHRLMVPATLMGKGHQRIHGLLESTAMIPAKMLASEELEMLGSFAHPNLDIGGSTLRVALACALVNDPPIVLIDQPELGLTAREIEGLGQWVEHESKTRLIIVASNKRWARSMASKRVRLGAQ
jgi:ABC-type multidrug transport system fused ATPase/permease subunit